jgi:tRNA 2-selenouridine synthase
MSLPIHSGPHTYLLAGPTGSGKSEIIRHLQTRNVQALDLETLCAHDGSVFASLTFGKQPTSYQFHKKLLKIWNRFDPQKTIFIESERPRIGGINLPAWLVTIMNNAPVILLQVDRTVRQERLATIIAQANSHLFSACLLKLHFKLHEEQIEQANRYLEAENFAGVADILMTYYDGTPGYTVPDARVRYRLTIANNHSSEIADKLLRVITRNPNYLPT